MQTVNHLVGVFVVDEVVIMVIAIDIVQKHGVDEVQSVDRLETCVVHAFLRLCHICFRGIEQDAFLERFCPCHLHLDDEFPILVVLATYVYDAVLFGLSSVGYLLRWPIFKAFHALVGLEWQEGIEQTGDEMFVLAKYLLESQVGFRI